VADRQLAAALAGSAASAAAGWPEGAGPSALTSTEARRWHWVLHPDSIELYADPDVDPGRGPDDQLVLLSSGGALHHAKVALAADGRAARVRLLPDQDPAHLATVTANERIEVTDEARARYETFDRVPRGHPGGPSDADLAELADAAATEGVRLVVLSPEHVSQLAGARPSSPRPSSATSSRPGSPRPPSARVSGDVFVVLCGDDDAPESWLRAGAALSAISLLATRRGLTVVPSSAAVQVPRSRAVLRRLLPGGTTPYVAVRIGGA
jgi:hypothetical protein